MSGLPADWRSEPLADLGSWRGGGTPSKANRDYWVDGTIPWLSPKDMGPNTLSDTQDHITTAAMANSAAKLVPAASVAVVTRSGILERLLPVALVPFDTTLNQDMKAVTPRDDVDPRWIAWGLRAFEREILAGYSKAGTTVASLDAKRLMAFRIPVPPLNEQRRIVDILEDHLSRLDAAANLLALADRRLAQWESSLLAECYRSGDHVPLPAVTQIQGGIQKQPKRAPQSNRYPFLRVANVTASGLDLSDVHEIELFEGELARLVLNSGDLLVVEGNGSPTQIGRAATWDGSIPNCVHQNHLIRVRPRELLHPGFLEAIWNAPQNRALLRDVASSTSGLHTLSVSKLKSLTIPVPELGVQDTLVARVVQARLARQRLTRETHSGQRRAATLRRAVMQAAFSGRLTGGSFDIEQVEESMV